MKRQPTNTVRTRLNVEVLENRTAPAVTSTFNAATGLLTVTGDSAHDSIVLSSNTTDRILVNGRTVSTARLTKSLCEKCR